MMPPTGPRRYNRQPLKAAHRAAGRLRSGAKPEWGVRREALGCGRSAPWPSDRAARCGNTALPQSSQTMSDCSRRAGLTQETRRRGASSARAPGGCQSLKESHGPGKPTMASGGATQRSLSGVLAMRLPLGTQGPKNASIRWSHHVRYIHVQTWTLTRPQGSGSWPWAPRKLRWQGQIHALVDESTHMSKGHMRVQVGARRPGCSVRADGGKHPRTASRASTRRKPFSRHAGAHAGTGGRRAEPFLAGGSARLLAHQPAADDGSRRLTHLEASERALAPNACSAHAPHPSPSRAPSLAMHTASRDPCPWLRTCRENRVRLWAGDAWSLSIPSPSRCAAVLFLRSCWVTARRRP